jgi:iron complex transport system substrate-binding protein
MRIGVEAFMVFCMVLATGSAFAGKTVPIKDTAGRTVLVPSNPERIVSIPVVMPPMLYAVDGSGERIKGMHPVTKTAVQNSVLARMAPELLEVPTGFIKGGFKVNIEELMKIKPDLVFQISPEKKEIEKIEAAGIPVLATDSGDFYSYYSGYLQMLGQVLDKEDRAAQLKGEFDDVLKQIAAKVAKVEPAERPKGLILFNVERLMATGSGSFANYWLENTGAVNAAAGIKTSPRGATVGMEQVLEWNPDIIYITNFCKTMPEDLIKNRIAGQDWSAVKAVKEGRVYKIPLGEYRWYPPSADSALMLKWMASKNHPALFADMDIKSEIKDHFKRIYAFELTDADVARILNPDPTSEWKWN